MQRSNRIDVPTNAAGFASALEQVFSLNDEVSPESIELYIFIDRVKLRGSDVRLRCCAASGYVLERGDECCRAIVAPATLAVPGLPLILL